MSSEASSVREAALVLADELLETPGLLSEVRAALRAQEPNRGGDLFWGSWLTSDFIRPSSSWEGRSYGGQQAGKTEIHTALWARHIEQLITPPTSPPKLGMPERIALEGFDTALLPFEEPRWPTATSRVRSATRSKASDVSDSPRGPGAPPTGRTHRGPR